MPAAAFDRDSMARDYARRHAENDPAILEIHYLTVDAPPDEIRLVEVNKAVTSSADPEPIDFGVDSATPNGHKLVVLDVTPEQWQQIRKGTLSLPEGWTLKGSREISGRQHRKRKGKGEKEGKRGTFIIQFGPEKKTV